MWYNNGHLDSDVPLVEALGLGRARSKHVRID